MSLSIYSNSPQVTYYARRSRELGKIASARSGSQAANAMLEKIAVDLCLVGELEKTARLLENFLKNKDALIRGGLYAAGAGIPVAAGGAYLMHRKAEEEKGVISDALAKGSLAAAGVGAALLGMHHLGRGGDEIPAAIQGLRDITAVKTSSENTGLLAEKVAAAYEAMVAIRDQVNGKGDDSLRKLAAEALVVANGHIADIVGDVLLPQGQ